MAQRIYSTTVTNDGGTAGWVRASDGPQVQTGPPSDPSQGVNPEQLLGMAWSTCLNATVEAVLRDRGVLDPGGVDGAPARSRVSVQVVLVREPSGEYAFVPEATVSVAGLEGADLEAVAEAAHARCPVSKLLTGRGAPVVVRTAAWDEGGEKGGDPRTQADDPLPGTVRGSGAVSSVQGRRSEQSGVAVDSPGQAR